MADITYWIQIENHYWDVSPSGIDRMTGQTLQQITGKAPITVTLTSPETGAVRNVSMKRPLRKPGDATVLEEAIILRRYTPNWAAPDDRKVNPWDLNEPNPTDTGTMGTIPGPVIECNVGDRVIVNFRNKDFRGNKALQARTHSLHPHGFVFNIRYDGAYPLSPPDPTQPLGAEAALWNSIGVTGSKKGDRVPPGGTFTYTWNTFGWPSTAGVWLYHDHSICDMENVEHGAIGIIVIHNPADPDDVIVTPDDLPNGSFIGSPVHLKCFPVNFPVPVLPHDLTLTAKGEHPHMASEMGSDRSVEVSEHNRQAKKQSKQSASSQPVGTQHIGPHDFDPNEELLIHRGDVAFELNPELTLIPRFCLRFYRTPPQRGQYLQLFHNLGDAAMCINGRKYLGNTPTMIAGLNTKMRFGLVGMGNIDGFHTFHLHGHRWVIPGPDGNNPGAIQSSPQVTAVSQFEDTRTFGPANSFVFTINEGSFMGSFFTPDPSQAPGLGEWHMHCHVLVHMMDGMMGSLLVIQGGELASALPVGEICPPEGVAGGCPPGSIPVTVGNDFFAPAMAMITAGQTVCWTNVGGPHTVTSNPGPSACNPASSEAFDSGLMNTGDIFWHTFNTAGTFSYHCEVHGCSMAGSVMVM